MDLARGHPAIRLLLLTLAFALSLATTATTSSQPCSQPTFERGPSLPFQSQTCVTPLVCPPSVPVTLLAMDVNGDSRVDVVAVSGSVDVFLGEADGTFTRSDSSSPGGAVAVLADFNGDGAPDLAVGGIWPLSVRFWANGAFGAPSQIADGVDTFAAADFDADGRTDLIVARSRWDTTPYSSDLTVYRNNGDGSFTPLPASYLPSRVTAISAGRFDRHPFADIIVMWGPSVGAGQLSLLAGRGDGTFGPPQPVGDGGTQAFALADLNGDGWPDIVASVTDVGTGECWLRTYLGNGDGRFRNRTANLVSPEFCGISSFVFADFNGDGFLDVAGNRVVLLGDGKGGLSPPVRFDTVSFSTLVPVTIETNTPSSLVALSEWREVTPWLTVSMTTRLLLLRNDCDGPGVSATRELPFIGAVPGRAGALFESDLSITNEGTTTADVDFRYTAALGEGSGSAPIRLSPGEQIFAPSALAFLRFLDLKIPETGSQGGSLRVHFSHLSSPEAGVVASRTASRGAGLWYAGREPGVEQVFVGPLKEDDSDRTNLALVNAGAPDAGDAALGVSVYSTDPSAPGAVSLPEIRLKPGEFRQIGRVLSTSGLNAASGYAMVTARDSTAPFSAHAIVNDNATSDGSYLAPTDTGANPTVRLVPSVVEAGPYSTEVTLANAGFSPQRVRLELPAPSTESNVGARAALIIDLGRGESLTIPDVFEEYRHFGLVPAKGPALARPMIVTSEDGGGIGGVLVACRVRNPAADGGYYSVFTPALGPEEMATTSAVLSDLRQDEATRTNIAITNIGEPDLGEGADAFRIEIFDGESGARVAFLEGIAVQRKGWRQLNSVLAGFAPGTKHGWARVTRTSGSGPFVAYAVINDGARPGEGTGDGSFVLGRPEQ